MNKKFLYLIAGVVAIILGILTIFDVDLALVLCSVALFFYGVTDLMRWSEGRKSGTSSIWTLLGGVLSLLLGACILISDRAMEFSTTLLIMVFALWLIAAGAFEILGAIMYRKAMTTSELGVQAPGSVTSIVSGSIMVFVGLLSLIIPVFAIVTARIWITVGLILTGVRMISMARSSGELEENT
ncbi:MAG: DUF308 domain-containing protein [Lachnospiraceae bacterium]|nr:DUF308 domain-containing protein [Lachnospiraceae bacterium]